MIKQVLKSADFQKLKGLKNAHIDFSESLKAIMGVNGSGKTTVIHALACAFSPEEKSDVEIIKEAAQILNKNYEYLIDNKYKEKTLIGVQLESGLKYSSLSMGAGEQRVIKILKILRKATAYSLVLIDEIDLLLHVSSLKKLIKKI